MRRSGEGSWRLSVDDEARLLHTAIFVRDACHLELPGTAGLPPPLAGDVPDRSALLGPGLLAAAGEQWLSWWREIVVFEAAKALGTLELLEGPSGAADSHVIVDEHLLDWPTLDALSARPELRLAVRVSHDDAVRWRRSRDRRALDPRARGLAHVSVSAIAETVVGRLEVSPARVRAAVCILDVEGDWSALPVPGLLLVSASVASDDRRLVSLFDAAFTSGVEAPAVHLPSRHRKMHLLPPSVIPGPVVLWEGPGASLACRRVIPYEDGFEIELRRHGPGPTPTPGPTAPRRRPNRPFRGLQVTLRYADGREELLDDVERDDREGPITVTTFERRGYGDDTLWLWVMPLPPPGEVRLKVEWPTFGIGPVGVSFDGASIRPVGPPA